MGAGSAEPTAKATSAVFLSYASEDAAAARRICEALRAAGIDVWFDQSELRGGDVWDQKIRQQIRDCALFVPIISTHTQARPEGYFRFEWKLAVDRSHLMAAERAFLVPVVVDGTTGPEALVPAPFREVQWTRIQAGGVQAEFVDRIAALLHQPVAHHLSSPERAVSRTRRGHPSIVVISLIVAAVVALVIATAMRSGWLSRTAAPTAATGTASASVATSPAAIPDKSVAVLPFVDVTENRDQEYFADGLTEELINRLTKVPALRVPARTSSFYFKGKSTTIAEIGKALGVAHVLEGSVRRSGRTLRVSTQLIRADSGYQIWSETFDRPIGDVFKVQDEIANAVVHVLKVSLAGRQQPESAPRPNIEAYTLFLQAEVAAEGNGPDDYDAAIARLRDAVRIDPGFAMAWTDLALTLVWRADWEATPQPALCANAHEAVSRALKLNPESPEAHRSMAAVLRDCDLNPDAAEAELKRVLALDPGSSLALKDYAWLELEFRRRPDEARKLAERAVSLDPLNPWLHQVLGAALMVMGRLDDAEAAYRRAVTLVPAGAELHIWLGAILMAKHQPAAALAEIEREPSAQARAPFLPFALDALGRTKEADTRIKSFETARAADEPETMAEFFACRHDADRAIPWLESAVAKHRDLMHDPQFLRECLKKIAADPRYKALQRKAELPG